MAYAQDMSTLTGIPVSYIDMMVNNTISYIGDQIDETKNETDYQVISCADIGIGNITIMLDMTNNQIKYKFTPSDKLKSCVENVLMRNENELIQKCNQQVVKRIMNAYKEML